MALHKGVILFTRQTVPGQLHNTIVHSVSFFSIQWKNASYFEHFVNETLTAYCHILCAGCIVSVHYLKSIKVMSLSLKMTITYPNSLFIR